MTKISDIKSPTYDRRVGGIPRYTKDGHLHHPTGIIGMGCHAKSGPWSRLYNTLRFQFTSGSSSGLAKREQNLLD